MLLYRYIPEKNPAGGEIPGVPLRDLTDEDITALPNHLVASVKASPMYEAATKAVGKTKASDTPNTEEN